MSRLFDCTLLQVNRLSDAILARHNGENRRKRRNTPLYQSDPNLRDRQSFLASCPRLWMRGLNL